MSGQKDLLFGSAVFVVQPVHVDHVDGNQNEEAVDAALLGKPETQLNVSDANFVQLIDKQNAASVGHDEPDAQ